MEQGCKENPLILYHQYSYSQHHKHTRPRIEDTESYHSNPQPVNRDRKGQKGLLGDYELYMSCRGSESSDVTMALFATPSLE